MTLGERPLGYRTNIEMSQEKLAEKNRNIKTNNI